MTPKEIAKKIREFYLQKHGGNHEAACEELRDIGICEISLRKEKCSHCETDVIKGVNIRACHVGRLIGRMGKNIDDLSKHLNTHVHVIEDEVIPWVFPYDEGDSL